MFLCFFQKYPSNTYVDKLNGLFIFKQLKSQELNKKLVFPDFFCFGILIHVLSWRQQKQQCLCFHYWDFLTDFCRNNWQSIFDVVERLCLYGNWNKFGILYLNGYDIFFVLSRNFWTRLQFLSFYRRKQKNKRIFWLSWQVHYVTWDFFFKEIPC